MLEFTKEELKNEIWKNIKGFEKLYQISSLGRIKSLRYNIIIKQKLTKTGYMELCLYNKEKRKYIRVHRLVAEHFLKNTKNKPFVHHINSIRHDNRSINLLFVTPRENNSYTIISGYKPPKNKQTKELPILLEKLIDKYGEHEILTDIIFDDINFNGLYKISTFGFIYSLKGNNKTSPLRLSNMKENYHFTYKNKVYTKALTKLLKDHFLQELNFKLEDTKHETWKEWYENTNYVISSIGRVFSKKTNKILKPDISNGYYRLPIYNNGEFKNMFVHRLVAFTFIENNNVNKTMVNHKNLNKLDNHYLNLEYVTPSENTQHYQDNTIQLVGKHKNPHTKLNDELVKEIFISTDSSIKEGKKHNLSPRHIRNIRQRKIWKHATEGLIPPKRHVWNKSKKI